MLLPLWAVAAIFPLLVGCEDLVVHLAWLATVQAAINVEGFTSLCTSAQASGRLCLIGCRAKVFRLGLCPLSHGSANARGCERTCEAIEAVPRLGQTRLVPCLNLCAHVIRNLSARACTRHRSATVVPVCESVCRMLSRSLEVSSLRWLCRQGPLGTNILEQQPHQV